MPTKKRKGKAVTSKGRKVGWRFAGYVKKGKRMVRRYTAVIRRNENATVVAVREGRERYWVVYTTKYGWNQSVSIPVDEPGEYIVKTYCVVGKRRKLIKRGFHDPPMTSKKPYTVVRAREKVVAVGKGRRRKRYRYLYVTINLPWFTVMKRELCPSMRLMFVVKKATKRTREEAEEEAVRDTFVYDDTWVLTDYGDWGEDYEEDYW